MVSELERKINTNDRMPFNTKRYNYDLLRRKLIHLTSLEGGKKIDGVTLPWTIIYIRQLIGSRADNSPFLSMESRIKAYNVITGIVDYQKESSPPKTIYKTIL